MAAASPAEWASFLSLGVSVHAALSVPYFVFVDADLADFDPRPAVRRARPVVWKAARSESLYPLLREWGNARHSARNAVLDAVALVLLLATSPKGALR